MSWLFAALVWVAKSHAVPAAPLPFPDGETLHYAVSWEAVPAGSAVFEVLPDTQESGMTSRHFRLNITSNTFVDWFYKIRDTVDGFCDPAFTHSLLYQKKQSGKEQKQISVTFDWEKRTALFTNFGGPRPPIQLPEGTFDPLSAFYKIRTIPFDSGCSITFPVTDGKKQFIQKVTVVREEKITLGSITYNTFLLVPEVNHFSGVFEKSDAPAVHVWVTADQRKLPVLIRVKVFIGSVIFRLENTRP